jgi:hypothetical protein
MSTLIYEYLHFQDYVGIANIGKLTTPQEAGNLTQTLGEAGNRLSEHVMNFEGGRFEVISHALLRVGDTLVISYLLRRPRGEQNMP